LVEEYKQKKRQLKKKEAMLQNSKSTRGVNSGIGKLPMIITA
jgi:hypothetical protein